ncbi:MAG: hypothetical protein ACYTFY_18725, partial [Planctomycetota bacterium]
VSYSSDKSILSTQVWAAQDKPDNIHNLKIIPTEKDKDKIISFEALIANNSRFLSVEKWPSGEKIKDFNFAVRPDFLFELKE